MYACVLEVNVCTLRTHECINVQYKRSVAIILIGTFTDHIYNGSKYFLLWLLGLQPCESTVRAAWSMTETFSTIVNFSLLGYLQRLHRL